jgi:hypothetical protein
MTLWEIAAAIEGHNRANGGGKPQPPSDAEFHAAVAAHEQLQLQRTT